MKIFLLSVLLTVLFFACSNDGLDVKLERQAGNVFCRVQEQNKCYDVGADICASIGGTEVESCQLENASSSSDIGNGGESSSSRNGTGPGVSSSSSGLTGNSSSSGGDVVGGSSSSGAEVDNSSSSVESSSSSLRQSSSSSLAPPSLSECNLPSYMHIGESILLADLPSLEGDSANCLVSYRLQVGSSSSTTQIPIPLSIHSGKTLTITANAQCGTVSLTKACKSVFVADNYVDFVKDNIHYPVNSGTTVIKMTEEELQNRLGCEYTGSNYGKPDIVFSVTVNGQKVNSQGSQNHWTDSFIFATDYGTNGNRILFETQNEGLECATTWIDP